MKIWDRVTNPFTFLNIYEDQVLIEPHGPDPVLFGIRVIHPIMYLPWVITSLISIMPLDG
ncbi:DUF1743 domain-containing protein [Vulcanisaeta sp. JCM 16159]|uniref:TiaS agmantine-binding domain-containing protein n=1 Tax=Vulcanisaeta sp. JCM 16159 TaxID=1295371 RepID=UPI000AB9D11F